MDTKQTFFTYVDRFIEAISVLTDDQWSLPSACEGWTAADVIDHIISTQRQHLTTHGANLPETPSAQDPAERFRQHADAVRGVATDDLWGQGFDGYYGPTTVGETLLSFYGFDLVVHRWDITTVTGTPAVFSDEEIAFINQACDATGDDMYGEGICKRPVDVASGASAQTKALARLGRQAQK